MEEILLGTTDRTVPVFIPDPASTDGSGKTGLVAADITVSYTRFETDNDVVVTDVTSSLSDLTALTDAHADWGFKEVSDTLAPGLYRLDLADAVFAAGAWYAVVYVMITTSAAAATPKAFKLTVADTDSIKTDTAAILADTGTDGVLLTSTERNAMADAILARSLAAESYAADAGTPTLSQMLWMIWAGLVDFSITGTTLTVKKQDGTTAMTFTLDDAVSPTSRTRAT